MKTVSKEDLTRRWREVLESAQREGVILEEGGVRYRLRAEKLDSAGAEPPKTPLKSLYGSGRVGHQAMLAGLEEGRRARRGPGERKKDRRRGVKAGLIALDAAPLIYYIEAHPLFGPTLAAKAEVFITNDRKLKRVGGLTVITVDDL